MAARKPKAVAWEVIRIGKSGVLLGVLYAADEDEAHAAAVVEYNIDPRRIRLLVRRAQ